jgi:hypothetical protein
MVAIGKQLLTEPAYGKCTSKTSTVLLQREVLTVPHFTKTTVICKICVIIGSQTYALLNKSLINKPELLNSNVYHY